MKFLLVSIFAVWFHPFYVSVVEINHNAAEKTLETSVRIFTDDFENTLKMRFPSKKIDLYKTDAATDSLISRYLTEKIALKGDGRALKLLYLGSERVEESTWCYFEVQGIANLKQLHITNRMLYEYKKEQINMHHITVNNHRKSYKLNNPETEADFTF